MASSFVIFGVITSQSSSPRNIPASSYASMLQPMGPCGSCPPGSNSKLFNTTTNIPCPVGIHGATAAGTTEIWLVAGYVFNSLADANSFLSTGNGALFKADMDAVFVIESI
jgi:hypothetical protein